jgi:flagellar motor switch protein FliN/FliY
MADDNEQVGQDDIEALLRQAQDGASTPAQAESSPAQPQNAAPPTANDATVDQAEIEALLGSDSTPARPAETASPAPAAAVRVDDDSAVTQNDIELLMNKAEQALASIDNFSAQPTEILPLGIKPFEFQNFGGTPANSDAATLELMRDVQLDMTIELGRTHMHLEDVLKLKQGAVVPLDKLAGDPADIYVNGRLVARGEVLVLNDNFCVRVAELIVGDSV